MAYPAARTRIVQHVDDRAGGVRDLKLYAAAPERSGPEYLDGGDVPDDKLRAVDGLLRLTNRPGGEDENGPEELLGKVPVLSSACAADITGIEYLRHQRPRIFDHLFVVPRCQRNRSIEPSADAPQPALPFPTTKELGGVGAADAECRRCVVDRYEIAALAEDKGKPLSIPFGWDGSRHTVKLL